MFVFLNDRFLPEQEAQLPLNDLGLLRGFSVFDFFRTVNGIPVFLPDYLDRFYRSASAMQLPVAFTPDELRELIRELINRNACDEAGIRILLTGGAAQDGFHINQPNLIITTNPITLPGPDKREKGFHLVSCEYQRDMPGIKTTDYKKAILMQSLVREKKADDLLYHQNQYITELPRCNIFMLTEDQRLVTPARNILNGVTRKQVLALAGQMGGAFEEDITLEQVQRARELFLTATSKRILPVTAIDGKPIGDGRPGPLTMQLYEAFLRHEKNYIEEQASTLPA